MVSQKSLKNIISEVNETPNPNIKGLGSTDKGGNTKDREPYSHCYDVLYDILFASKRESAQNILEIGVAWGGSLSAWQKYFFNAQIYGIDISNRNLFKLNRITHIVGNAYSDETLEYLKDISFDIIIDDGPHTLESQKMCLLCYLPKLASKGILVIEDILPENLNELTKCVSHFNNGIQANEEQYTSMIIDRRHISGLQDEINLIIYKLT